MSKPTIALSMIVRNEGHVLARCLRSVKPHITHWCIVDTGSTDDTKAVIRRELGDLPGVLEDRPWGRVSDSWWRRLLGKRDVDFAHNRNEALELARQFGTDYLLVIDADEELIAEPGALDALDADAYQARFELVKEGLQGVWPRRLLLKTSYPWAYQDAIHEHLTDPAARVAGLSGVMVKSYHDSARNQAGNRKKYDRDAAVLRRELKRNPQHARYWFYLGQACAGAMRIDDAIAAYTKRASFGDDWNETNWYAKYQIAALREFRGDHWRDVAAAYLEAFNARPTRAEPLWATAVLYNDQKLHVAAEMFARAACRIPCPADSHLVNESIYQWRAAWELANALVMQGKLAEGRQILERMLTLDFVPDEAKRDAAANIAKLNQLEAA